MRELGICIVKVKHKINLSILKKTIDSPTSNICLPVIAKGDSAASHHYWREKDKHYSSNIQPTNTNNNNNNKK